MAPNYKSCPRRFVNSDTSNQLMQRYLAENNNPTSLTGTEVRMTTLPDL